jgi:tetratricopeptide (TPR) repeat protein
VVAILALKCPVCGAPFSAGDDRCSYCGSILVLQTDHPRIDPRALNRAVIDEHIRDYRQQLRTDPHDVTAHYGLGVAYYNLGLTDAAIRSLDQASQLTPENPNIHTQLAVAYREAARAGDMSAAAEMAEHIQYALRLDPANVEAILLRSEEELERHDYERALAEATRAYAIEPTRVKPVLVRTLVAWLRWKDQRGTDTEADWQRLDDIDPVIAGEERLRAGKVLSTPLATPVETMLPEMRRTVSSTWTRAKGALKGFIMGIGIGLVAIIALTLIAGQLERDSGPYNLILILFAMSFFIPLILAVRGWFTARRKDTTP